jgi:hypothetical protein
MGRFLRSFRILPASLLLLRQHQALVVLLILSAAATVIIVSGFAVPIAMVFADAPNGSNGGTVGRAERNRLRGPARHPASRADRPDRALPFLGRRRIPPEFAGTNLPEAFAP